MKASAADAINRLESLAGASAVVASAEQLAPYSIAGVTPSLALQPNSTEQIIEMMKFAASEGVAIIPCGARTKLGIGLRPQRYDVALDLTRLHRIAAYDPGDLTLSVEPGAPLRALQQTLSRHGQFLPLGAPFLARATVGGTIVSGIDGPLRQLYGTARDFVLGMEFVSGEGVAGKSGGRVVKNVTGYDLHKPMIGSLGTLGVVTKINFRTFPAPKATRGFLAHFVSATDAVSCRHCVAKSPLGPLTFEILSSRVGEIFAGEAAARIEPNSLPPGICPMNAWAIATGFAGNDAVLDRCEREIRQIAEKTGAAHFTRIGDDKNPSHMAAVFGRVREFVPIALESSPAATIMKMGVLPAHLDHALAAIKHAAEDHSLRWAAMARGVGVIYLALLPGTRDDKAMHCVAAATNRIHEDCARLGGHSTILWRPDEWNIALNVWGTERADLSLMRKLKTVFDPEGILAPGRFIGGI